MADRGIQREKRWQALLEAGLTFKELAPWQWCDDWALIGVQDPLTGEYGYGSVMGSFGEAFGMLIFRGHTGLWGFAEMTLTDDMEEWERQLVYRNMHSFSFSLGDREDVDEKTRRLYRQLGYAFRGKQNWPVFSSFIPGYFAHVPDDEETSLFARFMQLNLAFLHRARQDDVLRHEWQTRSGFDLETLGDEYNVLCLVPADGHPPGRLIDTPYGEYTLTWKKVSPVSPIAMKVDFDVMEVERLLRHLPRRDTVWEFDVRPAPMTVGSKQGRKARSEIAMGTDAISGMIVDFDLTVGEEPSRPALSLIKCMQTAGYVPAEIRIARLDVIESLDRLIHAMDLNVWQHDELPILSEAFESMVQFMSLR